MPHLNFQKGGAWYDWTMVVFEFDKLNETEIVSTISSHYPYWYYATKLLAFVEHIISELQISKH
jgi:hypothetical protein